MGELLGAFLPVKGPRDRLALLLLDAAASVHPSGPRSSSWVPGGNGQEAAPGTDHRHRKDGQRRMTGFHGTAEGNLPGVCCVQ